MMKHLLIIFPSSPWVLDSMVTLREIVFREIFWILKWGVLSRSRTSNEFNIPKLNKKYGSRVIIDLWRIYTKHPKLEADVQKLLQLQIDDPMLLGVVWLTARSTAVSMDSMSVSLGACIMLCLSYIDPLMKGYRSIYRL